MLLLASVLALATSHAAPQNLRGSDTSSKTLIFVTEDHVSAHAKTMDLTLKSDWRAMLAAAPQYVAPRDDLSPLLLRSLHSAAAPHTAKWALAHRSTTPSTFTTAQYHSGAWMLSDLLLAAGATSITCETSPSSTLVQLTLLRNGLPLPSMADLYSARNALFDDHAALTSSLHRVPSHQGELDKFLARALGDSTGLSSSPLIVDDASAPVIANTGCRSGQVFVVASAALSNDQLTATLRPATSPMDIYNSIDSVFGLSDDPDCVPTSSPASNDPCTLTGAFPAMNLNYNSGNGGASQAITLNTGVSCPDCWATFSSTYSGSLQMCVNIGGEGFGIGVSAPIYSSQSVASLFSYLYSPSSPPLFPRLTSALAAQQLMTALVAAAFSLT